MIDRRIFLAVLALPLAAASSGAYAQQTGWEGTWVGRSNGGSVAIIVLDGVVTEYIFRGQPIAVNGSAVGPDKVRINVGSPMSAVKLTRTGANSAAYTFSDNRGGWASGSVTRRR